MPQRPSVSIIMPARDTEAFIGAAIDSVTRQTRPDWELIIVDDASTDSTAAIAQAAADRDDRIRVHQHTRAFGVSAARNTALEHARGEWVLFLDSDDLIQPSALAALLAAARSADTDAAFGAYAVCDEHATPLYIYTDARPTVALDDLFDRAYLWTAAHIVRRERLDAVRFTENLTGYEDRDVWLRLAERGLTWITTPSLVAHYRIRPGSSSKDAGAMLADAHRVVRGCHERQFTLPRSQRRLRLSPDRLRRTLDHLAIAYASRAAITPDGPGPQAAADLLRTHASGESLRATDAVRAGQYAVIYGLGRWPEYDPIAPAPWFSALRVFWQQIEHFCLAEAGLTVKAGPLLTAGLRPGIPPAHRSASSTGHHADAQEYAA